MHKKQGFFIIYFAKPHFDVDKHKAKNFFVALPYPSMTPSQPIRRV